MSATLLNPQQEAFLSFYTNVKSETFGNARQSALKAGYSSEYADNIMTLMPDWLSDNIGDLKRLRKAEKNLDEMLDMETEDDVQKLKIKQDTSKFVAERLGKNKYSTKSEIEHSGSIETLSKEQIDALLSRRTETADASGEIQPD